MPEASPRKIVVAGDVTLDWNLVQETPSVSELPRNSSVASHLSRGPGGAALLAELLTALSRRMGRAGGAAWSVVKPVVPGRTTSPASPRVHHSYVLWAPHDGTACRVVQFLGFDRGASDAEQGTGHGKPEADDPDAGIVVLSDAGLGFNDRDDPRPELWPEAIKANGKTPWVVYRSAPVGLDAHPWESSPLLDRLLERHAERTVAVLDVGDLRTGDVQVSRAVSWERTALDLLKALRGHEGLSAFRRCAGVVVSLGCSGAFALTRGPAPEEKGERDQDAWMVLDPAGPEGSFEDARPGRMVGIGTCLTAGVVRSLMTGTGEARLAGLREGVLDGVRAARRLHEVGYTSHGSEPGPSALRFPTSAVVEALEGSDEDEKPDRRLTGVSVPMRAGRLGRATCAESMIPPPWTILEALHGAGVHGLARRVLLDGLQAVLGDVPRLQFGGLVTVDRLEIEAYHAIAGLMNRYCDLPRPKRPLSIAVFGPPGSGKSFGIKQIAKSLRPGQVEALEFNLSQLPDPAGLVDALHQVRDVGIAGRIPLVFWDEFDTDLDGPLGWLRYFLAPMWDGVFQHGQITHAIGRAIFVFAGGTKPAYHRFVSENEAKGAWREAKGPDFVSRLSGCLDVLGPNSLADPAAEVFEPDPYYPIRRAIILRSLLGRHHPSLFASAEGGGPRTLSIDPGVARALLRVKAYRHGARSMESVLAASALADRRHFDRSCLPPTSQLELHVDSEEFGALVERWEPEGQLLEAMAETNHELFCERLEADGYRFGPVTAHGKRTHSSLVGWEELPADEKEQNRDLVRSIPDKLRSIGYRVVQQGPSAEAAGIDPGVIEELAREEHRRWVELKLDAGWRWGEETDKPNRVHEDILPWEHDPDAEDGPGSEKALIGEWGEARAACIGRESLSETARQKDRDLVRSMPALLGRHGFTIMAAEGVG